MTIVNRPEPLPLATDVDVEIDRDEITRAIQMPGGLPAELREKVIVFLFFQEGRTTNLLSVGVDQFGEGIPRSNPS